MVLRCISSSSMHKGHKGLKSVFWKKFRKRKAGAEVVAKKKWVPGDESDKNDVDVKGGTKLQKDVTENEKEVKITRSAATRTSPVIAVSELLFRLFVIWEQVICDEETFE